ncbi:hypothetical protein DWB84_03610 [Saccharophagus sp. K07]|nr:hypothetical protein [Saccharophagus sp. K07]
MTISNHVWFGKLGVNVIIPKQILKSNIRLDIANCKKTEFLFFEGWEVLGGNIVKKGFFMRGNMKSAGPNLGPAEKGN